MSISTRKNEHLSLALENKQIANEYNWWDQVYVGHRALPELNVDQIDLCTRYPCGNRGFPLMVVGMTGGTEQAEAINQAIAGACANLGLPMGLGSMRPWFQEGPSSSAKQKIGYQLVEQHAELRLYGNIGGTQCATWYRQQKLLDRMQSAVLKLQLSAVCVHLNPAQELVQPEGDRDFEGVLEAIVCLAKELSVPVIVKETGCGIDPQTAALLASYNIKWLDIAGQGGTSWTFIENRRSARDMSAFDQWGIPSPVATLAAARVLASTSTQVISSGGIRSGVDACKALVLGAKLAGIGRPVLSAWHASGDKGVELYLRNFIYQMKSAALLCGCRTINELQRSRYALDAQLQNRLSLIEPTRQGV